MPGAIPSLPLRKNKKIYPGWNFKLSEYKISGTEVTVECNSTSTSNTGLPELKFQPADRPFWSFSCFSSLPKGKYRGSASEYAKTASSDIPPVHYFQLILQSDATWLLTLWLSSRLGFVICFLPPQAICRYHVMNSERKLSTLYNLRALFSRRE